MRTPLPLIIILVIVILLGILGLTAEDEIKVQQDEYCSMVKIGIESNGEYGWPDFDGTYADRCK